MITKLGTVITEYSVRNKSKENIPVYSVTNEQGFCTATSVRRWPVRIVQPIKLFPKVILHIIHPELMWVL